MKQHWRDVFAAADFALDLEPAERQAYLDKCVAENPLVGAELKALIDGAAAASTLETPAADFASELLNASEADDALMRQGDEQVKEVLLVTHGDKADHLPLQFRDQIRVAGRLQVLAFSVLGDRSEILLSPGTAGLKREDRLKAGYQTRDGIRIAGIAWADTHNA